MRKTASYHHRQGEQLMTELLEKEAAFPFQGFGKSRLIRDRARRIAMTKKYTGLGDIGGRLRKRPRLGGVALGVGPANYLLPVNVSGGRTLTEKAIKDIGKAEMDKYRLLGAKQLKG